MYRVLLITDAGRTHQDASEFAFFGRIYLPTYCVFCPGLFFHGKTASISDYQGLATAVFQGLPLTGLLLTPIQPPNLFSRIFRFHHHPSQSLSSTLAQRNTTTAPKSTPALQQLHLTYHPSSLIPHPSSFTRSPPPPQLPPRIELHAPPSLRTLTVARLSPLQKPNIFARPF